MSEAVVLQQNGLPGASLDGVVFGSNYLKLPHDLPHDDYRELGRCLAHLADGVQWWLGDYFLFGEWAYGEKYSQEIQDMLGYSAQALRNFCWVAGRYEMSTRVDISWSHHRLLAGMEPDERDHWLQIALDERLSVAMLSARISIGVLVEAVPIASSQHTFYVCDLARAAGCVEAGSADYVITDPPYGAEHLACYDDLADFAGHALRTGGSLLAMSGQYYLPDVMEALSRRLTYQWTLAYLTPGGQSPQIWPRRVNTFWKPVLWFVKGDYDGPWIGDVARSDVNDNDKAHHAWGQSESGMVDLMARFCRPGDVVCDPMLGGGTTGLVAAHMGCRFIGLDRDPGAVATAKKRMGL